MQLLKRLQDAVSLQQSAPSASPIPPRDVYSILSNDRRRYIIAFLADFDVGTIVEVRDVADHLQTIGDDRQNAYISIIQQHGPRLEQSGLATYDSREKTLTPHPTLQVVYDVHKTVDAKLY
ncbi:DUF7344 domain-containing protein [Haloarchaeobius sp. TZWSO28]|uniref:DUF7344 domain-containing protein n=1 Tax=Haloarchaeobius sp. TZWSO28 TaxID=3446119 RepID=UPI003EBCA284